MLSILSLFPRIILPFHISFFSQFSCMFWENMQFVFALLLAWVLVENPALGVV